MFGRLLWKLLRGSRGRLAVALIALISGAAVISGLLNLDLDAEHKLTEEFRTLGPNLVISPPNDVPTPNLGAGGPSLLDASQVLNQMQRLETPGAVGAPYLFVVARIGKTPVVTAGTWLDEAHTISPAWKLEGAWVTSREDDAHCLVGRAVARQFHFAPGSHIELRYMGHIAPLLVSGVVDAGGTDDDQIFVNLPVAQTLAAVPGKIGLFQMTVSGDSAAISGYAQELAQALPQYDVRPIRQVTEAGGELLSRIHVLVVSMVLLILVLTALCVLATMAALAMERREDVGLMKALGGSISRIVGLFLAEVGVLGAVGGAIGSFAGLALSRWMGERVFGAAISPLWEIFPLTIALMVAVALAGALPLRLLGNVKPAAILRGE